MGETNRNSTKLVVGVVLITIGALVAVGQLSGFDAGRNLWPLYIIAPGLILFALGTQAAGKMGKSTTIAGVGVTATGLILAYQNSFNHFESWAYAWALIAPGAVGLGMILHGRREDDLELIARGRQLINIAAALFLFGAVFFEMILNISGRGMPELFTSSLVLPGLLVVAGLAVVFWPRRADH